MTKTMNIRTFASLTNYPELFQKTYWGHFRETGNVRLDRTCLSARNKFVERYKICRVVESIGIHHPITIFDHFECYKSKSGEYIAVCSPYGFGYNDENLLKQAEHFGMVQIPQMYDASAYTFARVFHGRTECARWARAINKQLNGGANAT